ncbi:MULTISPECIES: OmpH family outer membrane protein [unclassified Haematospirillum]|uniref:OmpH family outer membrane protein n=1 Tax=unclassified Haematospirillum TaxID=2622088 RepID=UPI001439A19F|nr:MULTISPECIES: OmpH family outer membrane protein [unclassified Haematospirillum]NKD54174.1 OmpH family outer membrane protein [Haematospirillum sp. H4890]NKD74219.1 OmpH family outer membrane protein [Haematospirillum sp. H4485]NKD87112.1 OmpH family outer membrane protein [Haematospirillum sp. 15-248]
MCLRYFVRVSLSCFALLLQVSLAYAGREEYAFGVLDQQKIMAESSAARMVFADRDRYQEVYQGETAKQEKKLRAEDESLLKLRTTLSPEEFARRQQAFQARVTRFQKQVQAKRAALERAFAKAMAEVQSALIKIVHGVAQEKGMGVIFYRSQVFLFDPRVDITDEVLERLNRDLPRLSMLDPSMLADREEDGGMLEGER